MISAALRAQNRPNAVLGRLYDGGRSKGAKMMISGAAMTYSACEHLLCGSAQRKHLGLATEVH